MDISELIGNVGFPVAVTFYLLVRVESKLELLTSSINNLARIINKKEGTLNQVNLEEQLSESIQKTA